MAKEVKDNYTIQLENDKGEIVISSDVIGVIAGLAAVEVDGVVSMAGEITKELISKLSKKALANGVKVDITEGSVSLAMTVNLKYGFIVMVVSKKVQEKVKGAVENMTGLTVTDINVRVAGIEVSA